MLTLSFLQKQEEINTLTMNTKGFEIATDIRAFQGNERERYVFIKSEEEAVRWLLNGASHQ
jgi:hypothetical protein